MSSPFALTSPQRSALQATMGGFDAAAVHKGRDYLRQGRVRRVAAIRDDPEIGYVVTIQGGSRYEVEWRWRAGDRSWDYECTCPVGYGCKHAYAAGTTLLQGMSPTSAPAAPASAPGGFPLRPSLSTSTRPAAIPPKPAPPPALPPEEAELVRLVEARHGRPLEKPERALLHELTELWRRVRPHGAVHEYDLARVAIGASPEGPARYEYQPVFSDWWDRTNPPDNPVVFWQYLAFYAEQTQRPIPALLRPITDTALVRDRLATRERRREVARWSALLTGNAATDGFGEPPVGRGELAAPASVVAPGEIRLRLTRPKLTWEFRAAPDGPWQIAKGGRVREWFGELAGGAPGFSTPAIALLQEVQLGRLRGTHWGSTEPQTLNVDEARTTALLHWLLRQPALRHQLVDAQGRPFPAEHVPLHWRGRPDPEHDGDLAIELVRADGSPAPADLLELPGETALAVAPTDATVFEMPPTFPGTGGTRRVHVPREVFEQPAVVRRLRRLALRVEGLELPEVEVVELRPRFVCTLWLPDGFSPGQETLVVEHHGVSPDGTLVQRRGSAGKWTTLEGRPPESPARMSPDAGPLRELDHRRADDALVRLAEFGLITGYESYQWRRSAAAKQFPEQFAEWAERVRAAGVELVCAPELAGLARPADRAKFDVSVRPAAEEAEGARIDWFDVEVAVRTDDATLTSEEIALLLKARGRFVRLPAKGWRRLAVELTAEETARLAELGLDPAALGGATERQRFHALQLADERIAGLLPAQHAERVRERAAQLHAIATPPVPAGLTAELRPYQREGFHFLAHLAANGLGGALADDMGLGKTVQALAWLLHLAGERAANDATRAESAPVTKAKPAKSGKGAPSGKPGKSPGPPQPLRVLIVCPKSVVPNWTIETRRFAPSLTVAPLAGRAVPADVNLVVANYTQLRLAAAELGGATWDAVILDEGQNIKNPQSQTAKVARELRTTHRVVLTGTPIENRTLDLWSLFAFAMPGLLGTQASFRRAFNDKTDPGAARARLARRVKHFMLRRTKSQVAADLPARIEEDLFVDLEGEQRRLYDAELKRTRALLLGVQSEREFDRQRFNILQSLLRLRQICCDPRLVGFEAERSRGAAAKNVAAPAVKSAAPPGRPGASAGRADGGGVQAGAASAKPDGADAGSASGGGDDTEGNGRVPSGSAKLEALLDTLEPLVAEGHRVLVFSQFVSVLELLAPELAARGIGHLVLTGQTENRQELVEKFQSADGPPVFLLSLKAAGSGLNLTAASYVVLFDPWWNPAVEAQAIDRTHRIGQKNQVIAYRLLARGTIEEKIRKLQHAKADLARSIVQEETLATVLSLDDLRFVLGEDPAE